MIAEILACACVIDRRGGAWTGGIVVAKHRQPHACARWIQILGKNICRIKYLKKAGKHAVRSSALDWQLNGVARRAIREGRSPAIEKQREKRRLKEAKSFGEFGEKWLTTASARKSESIFGKNDA